MGQYFMPILGDSHGLNCKVYDRSVDGEYMLAKLMEHSWWLNSFCNSFAENLYNQKKRVCWVGDYAEDEDFNFKKSSAFYTPCYGEIWGETVKRHGSISTDFTLDNKFLLNHDTKEVIDLDDFKEKSKGLNGWTIHPLPLLTAAFTRAISALNLSGFGLGFCSLSQTSHRSPTRNLIWFLKKFGNLVMFLKGDFYAL